MPAIIVLQRKGNNIPSRNFFDAIDPYVISQGFSLIDNMPKTYFCEGHIAPSKVKSIIGTIKSTDGYSSAVKTIFYSANLTRA